MGKREGVRKSETHTWFEAEQAREMCPLRGTEQSSLHLANTPTVSGVCPMDVISMHRRPPKDRVVAAVLCVFCSAAISYFPVS